MKPVALVVATFLLSHAGAGSANPVASAKSQNLTPIQSRLLAANQTIEQIKLRKEKLLAQLQNLEQQVGAAARSLHDLDLQIGGKQQRLKHLGKLIQIQQTELLVQKDELRKQVKAAFVMGKKEQLRLLINQQDPARTSRMLVYYHYLNKNRLKKLASLNNSLAQLATLEQDKLSTTKALAQVARSHQATKTSLIASKKQRDTLLLTLRQEFKEKSQQLLQIEGDEKETQALIDKLQQEALHNPDKAATLNPLDIDGNPVILQPQKTDTAAFAATHKPFAELKGKLVLPVKGAILKRFGSQRDDSHWDGVLISANEGTDIRAVTAGRVVFANWLRGYGLLIILDHGGGYMTLYAFNQTLYKKVGETVKAGTIIGAVGNSGGREAAGLYFGIRSNGKPVDPIKWCKK